MFITFEGVEGCGKTTQARLLADRDGVVRLSYACDAGTGRRGDQRVRSVPSCLMCATTAWNRWREALLYEAARAQFVAEVVRPALVVGTTVICDRYADSTLAYQGYGRGLSLTMLETLNASPPTGSPRISRFLWMCLSGWVGAPCRGRRLEPPRCGGARLSSAGV